MALTGGHSSCSGTCPTRMHACPPPIGPVDVAMASCWGQVFACTPTACMHASLAGASPVSHSGGWGCPGGPQAGGHSPPGTEPTRMHACISSLPCCKAAGFEANVHACLPNCWGPGEPSQGRLASCRGQPVYRAKRRTQHPSLPSRGMLEVRWPSLFIRGVLFRPAPANPHASMHPQRAEL